MINLDEIKEKFPFLTGIRFQNHEYIGIIQNSDDKIISFYDYEVIRSPEEKILFLENGETWWWESNRLLPINIFLQGQMLQFRYCMKTIVNKDVEIMFGSCTSLNNIMKKRIKKRQIQLIRKMD
ncbi:MAG TPA: hypothetical protein VIY47_08010 [Ignavibacteriaceae bacterium]